MTSRYFYLMDRGITYLFQFMFMILFFYIANRYNFFIIENESYNTPSQNLIIYMFKSAILVYLSIIVAVITSHFILDKEEI